MKHFNSKILLFGEHTVLYGSDVLLMPFPRYWGKLDFVSSKQEDTDKLASHRIMVGFSDFIAESAFAHLFNKTHIAKELSKGLYFNSNIPTGYGVGSSGALVAAFYHEFKVGKEERNIEEIRRVLAELESYFHGSSSGFDPLVSYLDKPLLKSDVDVKRVNIDLSSFHAFLIDTGIPRSTSDLVSSFKARSKATDFESIVIPALAESTNQCVKAILEKNTEVFFSYLKELSTLQFQHLQEFISTNYLTLWKKGLDTDDFYLKLCGAGGGGYLLGFAKKSIGFPEIKNLSQL